MSVYGDKSPEDMAIIRLKVGAPEDLSQEEIDALLKYIEDLETRYDNVMSTLNVDYDDMFPPEEGEVANE